MSEGPNNLRNSENQLIQRVRAYSDNPLSEDFETLALDLFRHQFTANLPFQRYARRLGHTQDSITCWQDIPAVPTMAFKLHKFPLIGAHEGTVHFLTSGTTSEIRGVHHFPDTSLYEQSLLKAWQEQSFPDLPRLYLAPSPSEVLHSSLGHMFGTLGSSLADPFLLKNDRFQLEALFEQVRTGTPLFLMGTALAFFHLMETHGPIPLPGGSHLLETGGYKGTSRSLSKPDFYQQLADFFSAKTHQIHNEYGMTELSSQAYASGPDGRHRFPAWCRHLIRDPETGHEVPAGKIGYLQIHDLANVHSVAGIRTQDFAIGHTDDSFTLLGRDPGALPRGCSRSIDQALSS